MNTALADLRFALRGLRRSPLFSIVAILSLALGIGANTAIFTLIDQMLLRKLPVSHPDELVMLYQRGPHNGSNMGTRMHSYPLYQELQQRAEPLAEVLCRRLAAASVSIDNQTERVEVEMVSGNFFSMLGVKPALGRVLNSQEDDRQYQGHPVVVLSYGYWESRFARDPERARQEDPGERLPDDDRRRVAGGLRRHRPGAVAADSRADPDEAGDRARLGLGPHGRPPDALGPGVRAAEARLHGGLGEGTAAGTLHADPRLRDDAAGGEGLVAVLARTVHEGADDRRDRGDGLLRACATISRRRSWS